MSRDHLVQRQITDKNGVTTTRWVKPESSSRAVSLPSPKVSAPAVDSHYQSVLARAAITLGEILESQGEGDYWDDVSEMHSAVKLRLSKYSGDTLNEVCGLMEEKSHLAYVLYQVMGEYAPDPIIRDFVHLQKVLDEGLEITQDGEQEIREAIMALDHYPELPTVSKSGPYPMDRVLPASAVIEASYRMRWSSEFTSKVIQVKRPNKYGLEITVIANPELAKMVIERPYEVQHILALVEQRGEDISMVREIIDAEAQAVSGGML